MNAPPLPADLHRRIEDLTRDNVRLSVELEGARQVINATRTRQEAS
jgi:hypothetical protein